jgi:hypothetical protein
MAHHHKYHVKIHTWVRGVLKIVSHEFANLDAAITFANNQRRNHEKTNYEVETEQLIKVYNSEDSSLVTSIGSATVDPTYA